MTNLLTRYKNSDPAQRRSAGNIFKFLAVLLAFTIIARGTSGATLARVDLATPIRSEIIDAISGNATVSATDIFEMTVPEGLTVAEMLTNVGQNVEVGDAIAVFQMADVEEQHIRETAGLNRMNLDLERLQRDEDVDIGPVENAQRHLRRMQEDYASAVRQGESDIATARDALALLLAHEAGTSAGQSVPPAIRDHQRALDDWNAAFAQGQADVTAAEEAASNVDDSALQTAIRTHQRALEDFETARAQGEENVTAAQETLDELRRRRPADIDRTVLDNAQRNYDRARDDYDAARLQGDNAVNAAWNALLIAWSELDNANALMPPNPAAVATALAAVRAAETTLTNAENTRTANILQRSRALEDAATALAQAQRNFDNSTEGEIEQAETALENAQNSAAQSLLTVTRALENAESGLEQAQQAFENSTQAAQTALTNAQNLAADRLQAATRTLENAAGFANTAIEQAQTALQNAINAAENSRRAAAHNVENAVTSLNTAEQTHRRNIDQNVDTAIQNNITISTLLLDISAQQIAVDILDGLLLNEGTLFADYGGVVSMAMQNGSVTGNAPFVAIRDMGGGFEAQMRIPRADAERLAIGNEAEVAASGGSIFFTPTTTGTVSGISLPDENDNVTVTIALPPGNWSDGQRADTEIVLNRANYDLSLPISAIRSDNSGYFLYVVETRSTVLGLQNVVVRVNVTIVAADNDMVAVRGPVSRDSQVITGSNKAVSAGDRVRVGG